MVWIVAIVEKGDYYIPTKAGTVDVFFLNWGSHEKHELNLGQGRIIKVKFAVCSLDFFFEGLSS